MGGSIQEFWSQKQYAVVGVSRRREKFGNAVFREMKKAGFEVVPINRNADTINDTTSYAGIKNVPHRLDAVVVVVSPNETEAVLRQCADSGIKHVWLQQGAESERAIALGEELKLNLIHHECALMFLPPTRFPHSLHLWAHKLLSRHPHA